MKNLQGRLILAFAAVSLVSIAATAAITGAFVRTEFDRYFFTMRMMERPPVPPPGARTPLPGAERSPMPGMRDPSRMRDMMRRIMGAPELQFLDQLRRATWRASLIGLLAAVLLGIVVARHVAAPLRQVSAAAVRVGQGDLSQQVPVLSDDELGNLAKAFNAMTVDLKRLDESRRHLVADIAHELGTPLSVLQANLEGMLDGIIEPHPDRLAALHTQVTLLARLVNDLRDLSLAQAGRLVLDRRPTDLAALVADAAAVVSPHAAEKGVELLSRLAPNLPTPPVDRDRILQVIHNLLDNAIRHTPAGGTVTVGLDAHAGRLRLWVADTGSGIPQEEVEHVFDRFYRLDASRARASGGAGLGLAIVKSIVEAHGGQIQVASTAGGGSTFTVTLPVV
ncbi:MAG: ATP-binding protein [Armatimonadota bacterium]|nr:ATP-binding protein [Armatimonadota bacterium]